MLMPSHSCSDFAPINSWVEQWFAESDKCINEYICCGKDTKPLRAKMAKVYSFWTALKQICSRLANSEDPNDVIALENLYARLQCLIDLSVEE
jgi:hypothetical protein